MKNRRGVAMLIALMTMTVFISGIAIIAQVRSTNQIVELRAMDSVFAQDIFRIAEVPIQAWLKEQASKAVVDPDIPAPMIAVSDDRIDLGIQQIRVRIVAWDQYGMIPRNANELGVDFANADEVSWNNALYPGLDMGSLQVSVFPSHETPDAIGGLYATHNPWPSRSGTTRSRSGAMININTAPVELVERIFNKFNLGDVNEIVQRRSNGELATVSLSADDARKVTVRIVGSSRLWSFRVDVWTGTIRRSCWCVYSSQGGSWKLVQRIGIDDD